MLEARITYRPCEPGDAEAVLKLWRGATVAGSTDDMDAIETRLERDRDLFLLAWDGERLVGSAIGGWDGWRANVYRLVVSPEYRRRGIASELVERVEAAVSGLGARRIYALASNESPQAADFWSALGYELNSRIDPLAKWIEQGG